MRYSITNAPAYSTLDLHLDAGEDIVVQPGSMIAMDTGFDLTTRMGGALARRGSMGSLRNVLVGESVIRVCYRARRDAQMLSLAPSHPGDIVAIDLADDPFLLARGVWLASVPGVDLQVHYSGVKGWMTSTGVFLTRAQGPGLVFCTTHGGAVRRDLAAGERLLVDNRYIVAFSAGMTFEPVTVTKELGSTVLSGEGLVTRYTGPGTVIYQTRPVNRGGGWLSILAQSVF